MQLAESTRLESRYIQKLNYTRRSLRSSAKYQSSTIRTSGVGGHCFHLEVAIEAASPNLCLCIDD